MPLLVRLFNGIVCTGIGLPMLCLALWFPAMRYELRSGELVLRYGPVLTYRIPLSSIVRIRRRNLAVSLWSSMRLPGLALFKVPYSDVGTVRMCATSASRRILLIETRDAAYGLTPVDEEGFVAELKSRMGV
jgi:hypothetical protein